MNIPQAIFAKPAWWFAGACGVLCLVLLGEWVPAAEAPPVILAAPAHKHTDDATQTADAGGDKDTKSWAETINARPLFAVGRRPPKSTGTTGAVASTGMPRLSGIIITRGRRRAIFMPDGGKPLVLAEGASLDEGTIRRIVADRVFITGPKGDQVVYPTFDPNHVPSAPAVVPNGPMFRPNGIPGRVGPMFPNAFTPVAAQPAQDANDDSSDDNSTPAPQQPVLPPPPGGFRNPMFPRGRPE